MAGLKDNKQRAEVPDAKADNPLVAGGDATHRRSDYGALGEGNMPARVPRDRGSKAAGQGGEAAANQGANVKVDARKGTAEADVDRQTVEGASGAAAEGAVTAAKGV